ncbi:DUF4446 family protein [Paenibacillus apis]|uniref:DUF4446 family protein n=1 Tax=Paenibacillus apis TaxID=1792174 RepID=A0A919Y5F2_9BACL|nr:DUF4446 family protein [Paenibacillus apis]GIO44446.1 hypothetical protein J41TS4_42040 [Paenibacillus apis]
MQEWNALLLDQMIWIVMGFVVILLWLLLWNLIQGSKLRGMRKRYNQMMAGTGIEDLEGLLIDLKNQQALLEENQNDHNLQLERINLLLPKQKAKIGIKRYNAFGERGNELSFSAAFVDDQKNGIIITGLYSRDGSYVYAKPLEHGQSSYALSSEEEEAIALAGNEA